MMLADEICKAVGSRFDRASLGAISSLSSSISIAERFSISADVRDASRDMAMSRPSSIIEATKRCRLPFRKCWLEWESGSQRRPGETEEKEIPERFGVLLECLDDSHMRFTVTFAWIHAKNDKHTDLISICPQGYVVNWYAEWPIATREQIVNGIKESKMAATNKKYLLEEKEIDATFKLSEMVTPVASRYMLKMLELVKERSSYAMKEKIIKNSSTDVEGELTNVISTLCLLNSRNCVERKSVDLKSINIKRNRLGKKPLLSYSEVTINLSKGEAAACARRGMTEAEIRAHKVRGHFKIRKSGVFFWRPFKRGDPNIGEVKHSNYKVVCEPSEEPND